MQLAVCEFARNELGWEGDVPTTVLWFVNVRKETWLTRLCLLFCSDANSTEFDPESQHPVVRNP